LEQETNGKSVEAATALENSLKAQTIQVFIEGLGKLKYFINARNPPTLEKAIQAAREEERVQKSLEESKRFYENSRSYTKKSNNAKPNSPCYYCKKLGHWSRDCQSVQKPNFSGQGSTSQQFRPAQVKTITCRYCKNQDTQKRCVKYVNSQRNTETSDNTKSQSGNLSQSGANGRRLAGSIKTAAISFHKSS